MRSLVPLGQASGGRSVGGRRYDLLWPGGPIALDAEIGNVGGAARSFRREAVIENATLREMCGARRGRESLRAWARWSASAVCVTAVSLVTVSLAREATVAVAELAGGPPGLSSQSVGDGAVEAVQAIGIDGAGPAGGIADGAFPVCNTTEVDVSFRIGEALYEMEFVMSADDCKERCASAPECGVYTWGDANSGDDSAYVCALRRLPDGPSSMQREPRKGLVSGLFCRASNTMTTSTTTKTISSTSSETPTTTTRTTTTSAQTTTTQTHTTTFTTRAQPVMTTQTTQTQTIGTTQTTQTRTSTARFGSLFCWLLFVPGTYEEGLVRLQHRLGTGIFGCDEHQLYTNRSFEVTPGVATRQVDVNLTCEYGGKWYTALNNGIFMKVWSAVAEDRIYLRHDWTVKVDADTVFFPERLRRLTAQHAGVDGRIAGHGMYLNNCRFGLHGPIEVLSSGAVTRWTQGMQSCREYFHRQCSGSCLWGEDKFMDQCLWKVLGVQRDDEHGMMMEDHCTHPEGWNSCTASSVAAFHPFKSQQGYFDCWTRASQSSRDRLTPPIHVLQKYATAPQLGRRMRAASSDTVALRR
mmetsp:Transcript_93182/g.268196  ORF Transcript_93182/g.268196 Transcript_93182/m.268196 type:complete len:582 (+) Transcript_93182:87-1832(+)